MLSLRDISTQQYDSDLLSPNLLALNNVLTSVEYHKHHQSHCSWIDASTQMNAPCDLNQRSNPDSILSSQQFINDHYKNTFFHILCKFSPTCSLNVARGVLFLQRQFNLLQDSALQFLRSIYERNELNPYTYIINPTDDNLTPVEIVTDVLTNPAREITGFLQAMICSADNAHALFNASQLTLLDPQTGMKSRPTRILSKAVFNFLSSFANRPKSDLFSVLAIVTGAIATARGSNVAGLTTIFSSLAMMMNPNTTLMANTQKAALYNMSQIVTLRQTTRFIVLASILLLTYKIGGAAFSAFARLFKLKEIQAHAFGIESLIVVILGLLTTWLSGHYHSSFILDFLRTSSLIGGANFVCNTLNDAIVFITRLIADFATWVGLKKITKPLNDFISKSSVDKYMRRGGKVSELLPKINTFLAAKPVGITGPGTLHFIQEGRELIRSIDACLAEVTAIDGAGHLLSMLSRYRQQITSAIENSIFTSENSSERFEPVMTLFCGGPRIGKTMFVNSFINALKTVFSRYNSVDGQLRHTGILATQDRWVYSRNSDDPFFSGYNKQALIFYDDIFTSNNARDGSVGSQRHEQELSEIQHLVSSQPYAPPMPEVGAGVPCPKGTYISPAFVVATSNFLFPNSGSRDTTVIDDRISKVILVVHDPDIEKDQTFSHLHFFQSTVRLSQLRSEQEHRGWVDPYSPMNHFPTTLNEFRNWNLQCFFKEVTIQDLIADQITSHEQRLIELQIRRAGAMRIANGEDDYIDKLVHSFSNVCNHYALTPPLNFRARLLAQGLTGACAASLTPSGKTLQETSNGPINFCLSNGVFGVGHVSDERECLCECGHTSILLCPHFSSLSINFSFIERDTTSPPPRLPPFSLVDGRLVKNNVDIPLDVPFWRTCTSCFSSRYPIPVLDSLPLHDGDPLPNSFVVIVSRDFKNPIGLGYYCEKRARVSYITSTGTIREAPVERARPLATIEPHSNGNLFDFIQLMITKSQEPLPEQPTDDQIRQLFKQIDKATKGPKKPFTEEQRDILLADYTTIPSPDFTPSRESIVWVDTFTQRLTKISRQLNLVPYHLDDLTNSTLLYSTAKNLHNFNNFSWKYLLHYTIACLKITLEWESPVRIEFKKDHVALVNVTSPICKSAQWYGKEPLTIGILSFLTDLDVEIASSNSYSLSCLCSFVNSLYCIREPCWTDKLTAACQSLWSLLTSHKKVLLYGLAAFAGAFLVGSLVPFTASFIRRPKITPHGLYDEYHHPSERLKHPWPETYHRLLRSCFHPNTARVAKNKCRLCANFSKSVTHSNWDYNKEKKIFDDICQENSHHPDLKPFLLGVYTFNSKCISLLGSNDEEHVRQSLLRMAWDGHVPFTGAGMTRHLYIFRAWHCYNARYKAIETLTRLNENILHRLGSYNGQIMYKTQLTFPRTCAYESQPIENCTLVSSCTHPQKHAYYLPSEPVKYSAIDKVVATATSGCGFIMTNGHVRGRGLVVADGVLLTAAHVLTPLIDNDIEIHWRGQTRFSFFCSSDRVQIFPNSDLILVRTSSDELPASQISSIISPHPPKVGSKVSIVKLNPDLSKELIPCEVLPMQTASTRMTTHYFVSKHLEPGDSGSIVVQGGSIVGHYHGAYDNKGVVCYWPSAIEKHIQAMRNTDFFDSRFIQYVDDHGFAVIDEFDTKQFDSNPPTSERKTELHDAFASMGISSVKAPASLSQEALEKSIYKWQPVEEYFDSDYATAASDYSNYISTLLELEHGKATPFETWDDAVNGCELNKARNLKKVDMSTSAGAPWCDNGITKSDFIDDSCPDRLKCKQAFVEILDQVEEQFRGSNVAGYTATANSKDELRDLERVRLKKTRLFCATPLHHNVMFRKYYGKWISQFKALPYNQGFHAMGCDVFGTDWNDLYNYLMSPPAHQGRVSEPVFLAGDFSRFDTSHSGWKMRLAFKVAAATSTEPKMCDALAMSISRFGLRFRDKEFKVPAGLPSGCQMTTPINCVLNTLLWLTVWRKLTGGNLQSFKENTRLVVYGDDVVFGIDKNSPHFKYLTPERIQNVMKQLGYDLESADDLPLRWVPISEVTFLKRRFVPDPVNPNLVHAPRPLDEVYTQLMWRRSEPTYEAQQCCFYAFAAEIGQHPKTVQQQALSNLREAIRISGSDLCKHAISSIDMAHTMERAYLKQLELTDLLRLRTMFWRLW
uniref:Non-structural protein n=1 Tax=Crocidura shantungensis picorna-like virus 3 TaxID=3139523 RepID=A0AB38ZK14_9VIRU